MLLGINLCPPLVIDMMHHANCQTEVVHSLTAAAPAEFFCILAILRKKIHVYILKNFNVIFGPFARRHRLWRRGNTARRHRLGAIAYGAEVTQLGAIADGAAVRVTFPQSGRVASTWHRARRHRFWRRARLCY
jgi:hypothetical protein